MGAGQACTQAPFLLPKLTVTGSPQHTAADLNPPGSDGHKRPCSIAICVIEALNRIGAVEL